MTVLASIEDPDGRRVELTEERWRHITADHPEMTERLDDVTETVTNPGKRFAGREANEEWFYREGVGPTRWLNVVVIYETDRAFIVTSHGRRSFP
jgi:hypothetical protein